MDRETTIAQGLRITDDSAGYAAACKRVLSEKANARVLGFFLYTENHSLGEWFKKAYGGEEDKKLLCYS